MSDAELQRRSPYFLLGEDEELVHRIARSFYTHMAEAEPALAQTHTLDGAGRISERTQQRFARFLVEWLGGPARFTPENGHPRLRMRHGHVPIDSKMRDAWVRCMRFALDECDVRGEVRVFLDARFFEVADFLRNRLDYSRLQ